MIKNFRIRQSINRVPIFKLDKKEPIEFEDGDRNCVVEFDLDVQALQKVEPTAVKMNGVLYTRST